MSEVVWIQQLMKDFQIQQKNTAVIYCDNQAALHIASNPIYHERTKHIEIDLHFVREHLQRGLVKLLPIRTQHQIADAFTKPLASMALQHLTSKMNLKNIFSSP